MGLPKFQQKKSDLTECVTGIGFWTFSWQQNKEKMENIQFFNWGWQFNISSAGHLKLTFKVDWPIILVVAMLFFRQFSSGPKVWVVAMLFFGQFSSRPLINMMLFCGRSGWRHHIFAIGKADVVHGELFYSIEAKTWFISLLIYIFWSKLKKEMIQSFIWIESFCLFFAWWGWRWARRKQEELDKYSFRWGKQKKINFNTF